MPVKMGAWIGLSARCDLAVRCNSKHRKMLYQDTQQIDQNSILNVGKNVLVGALKFNTDGEIIAALTPLETRRSGMPCTLLNRHKLDQLAVASDQKMRRYTQILDGFEVRMSCWVERIGEQLQDCVATEFSRRQTNAVHHNQIDAAFGGPLILVWRGYLPRS